jgi:hypothetical protein
VRTVWVIFKIGWGETARMVEISFTNGLRAMKIFKVRQNILALERCQEIYVGSSIGIYLGIVMPMGCLRKIKISHLGAASFSL